jgi:hypothetical protein
MTSDILKEQALLDVSEIKIDFTPVLFISNNMKYSWSED